MSVLGTTRTFRQIRLTSAIGGNSDDKCSQRAFRGLTPCGRFDGLHVGARDWLPNWSIGLTYGRWKNEIELNLGSRGRWTEWGLK